MLLQITTRLHAINVHLLASVSSFALILQNILQQRGSFILHKLPQSFVADLILERVPEH